MLTVKFNGHYIVLGAAKFLIQKIAIVMFLYIIYETYVYVQIIKKQMVSTPGNPHNRRPHII